MSDIAGLAASAAGGGIFGLAGTLVGRAAHFLERRQDYTQERARWAHQRAMLEAETATKLRILTAEEQRAAIEGAYSGLQASLAAEASIGETYIWVNAVRALTRPVLTLILWLITGAVFLTTTDAARASIIDTATFAATAATLWWFGDRGPRRPG
jgi:hypothetical protein